MSDSWRSIMAALANDDARTVYCRLQTGAGLAEATAGIPPKKRERVLALLTAAGLIDYDEDAGEPRAAAPFAGILTANPVERATGVERFLKLGRIDRYPMASADRHALLLRIAEQAFRPDEELAEAQVNERLRAFTDDHVTLRRHLVDFGILERTRSGTSYALSPERAGSL